MAENDSSTAVDRELTPEEAEASFVAGFDSIHQVSEPLGETKPSEDEDGPGRLASADSTSDSSDTIGTHSDLTPEAVAELQRKYKRMEGRLASVQSKLDKLNQTVGQQTGGETADQQAERQQLLKHLEDIDKSVAEFQELAPVKQELEVLAQKVEELKQSSPSVDIDRVINEKLLQIHHPNWKEVASSDEFRSFMLEGGPSREEYAEYARFLNNPSTADQAAEYVSDWQKDYPDWWNDKGQGLFSEDPVDSITALDRFEEHRNGILQNQRNRETQQQRIQRRLRSNIVPQGTSGVSATGLSDDEAFERGFKQGFRR